MKADLAKSSSTGVAQFIISTFLVLITIPLFVRFLGIEAYGIFSLVALIGSVNTFANLGLNSALIRFLAEQGKSEESDQDIIVNIIILLLVLCPLTLIGFIFQKGILIHFLNLPLQLLDDAQWLYNSMLVGNFLVLLGQSFTAILDSQQKIYLTNFFQMVYNIIYWGLILLVISLGYSLKTIALVILVSAIIWFSIVTISALKYWGPLSLNGLRSRGIRSAKKQLTYGLQIYTGGLINLLYEPLTKIFLSHFLGIKEVGFFDIGLKVRNQVVGLTGKFLAPLYPILSRLTDGEKIRLIVHDIEQKTFFFIMPFIAVILLTMKPIVLVFFHSDTDIIVMTNISILTAFLLGSITIVPMYYFLMAKGHASKTIILQSVNVIVNALMIITLFPWLGYYAILIANAIAILSSFGLSVYYQKLYLNSLIFDSVKQLLVVLVTFTIALSIGYYFSTIIGPNLWKMVSCSSIIVITTVMLYRRFNLINHIDVVRYLGEGNIFSRFTVHILCRK